MIKKTWQIFKESWKLDIRFLLVILFDLLFYAIIVPCFFLYAFLTNRSAGILQSILGAKDTASYLSTASQFEISMMTGNLKSFVILFIAGAVILFFVGLFSLALSRTLIWNYLLKKRFSFKRYLKMALLIIVLFVGIIIVLLVSSVVMLLNRTAFSILFSLLMLFLFYFVFNAKINFTKTGKIFDSIGNAFKNIDRNVYLLCLIPFIVVMLITFATSFMFAQVLNIIISMILIILFSSWMRLFVLETQK